MSIATDLYKSIQKFIVAKLDFDTSKVKRNYDNAPVPKTPWIGIYIESFNAWTDYEEDETEDGTIIQISSQSIPVIIDFYGDLSTEATNLQSILNLNTSRTDLELENISVDEIGSVVNLTRGIEESEHIERYQLRCIFSIETSYEDTSIEELTEVEVEIEIETNGAYSGTTLAVLDEIAHININEIGD